MCFITTLWPRCTLYFTLQHLIPTLPLVAWKAVIDGVQEARAIARLRPLACHGMTGAYMLGLVHDAVMFLVEQLQGAHRCQRHTFRFFKQFSQEDDLPVNPSGCARSELYLRFVDRRHIDRNITRNLSVVLELNNRLIPFIEILSFIINTFIFLVHSLN